MAGYAIVCDARAGEGLGIGILMLVDRAKSKRLWWTSDDSSIGIRYRSEYAAQFAAKRLRYNCARVVDFDQAARAIHEQSRDIIHNRAMSDSEIGWDAHKGYF